MRAHPQPAGLPLPGGQDGATVRVHPMHAGAVNSPPDFLGRPSGPLAIPRALAARRSRWSPVVVPTFLIEHPSAGLVLVDTGFDRSVATDKKQNLGRLGAAFYDVRMKPEEAIPDQVRARGFDPADVRLVVMTHLHFDHASGVSQFPAATFVVSELEWTAATSRGSRFKGFLVSHFDHDYDWRTIDWNAAYVEGHATFPRTVDLLGDGSIRLAHTPGHTPGHQSPLLRLADRNLLLTGDATYAIRSIDEDLVPIFVDDMHDFRRSTAEIRNYRTQNPGDVVICGHDQANWPAVEALYS